MKDMQTTTLRRPPPTRQPKPLHASISSADLTTSASKAGASEMIGDELTPGEVAQEFKVSPATVRRWEARGILKPTRKLPGSGHRRYSRADIEAFKKRLGDEQDYDTTAD